MTRMSIGAAIRTLADRDPTAAAVRDRERSLSRSELVAEAERWSRVLDEAGVVHGDHVGIVTANRVADVSATVAVWMLGATPQPISPRLPPAERRRLVELGECRVTIGGSAEETPGCAVVAPDAWRAADDRLVVDRVAPSWKAFGSGGSTGTPKLVVADAEAMVDPDAAVAAFIPRAATQLVVAPLSHSAPFTYAMRGLMTGHALVLEPRFEPAETLAAFERHRITWAMLVPTMMNRMLRLPAPLRASADLASLEAILHIGSPVAPWVKHGWIDWIGASRVVEVYAGSESAGIAMIGGEEWLEHPGSVGRGVGGSHFRVVDADGVEVAPGVVGLIEMRRDAPAGYHYRGAKTPHADGWHTLSDLGHIDAEGWIYLAERADDVILHRGERFFPAAIEAAVESDPQVRSAVAVGIPDGARDETIGLAVDLAGASLTPELSDRITQAVHAACSSRVEPLLIVAIDRLARDDAGKTRRRGWRSVFDAATTEAKSPDGRM